MIAQYTEALCLDPFSSYAARNATHHPESKLVLCQMTVYVSSLN